MSTSTDAILAYGYDLGDSPAFAGIGNEDFPRWWDGEEDFDHAADRRLLDAEPEAKYAGSLIGLETHCSDGAPMYLLVVRETVIIAERGDSETVGSLDVPGYADARLAWAVETLSLDIGDRSPQWLLASYWAR